MSWKARKALTGSLGLILLVSLPAVVSAHASVLPRSVAADSYEKFTLRIPNERDVPTVRVHVEMPEGFQVSRVRPLPGWTYRTEKTPDGKLVRAIEWDGGKIQPGEFQEFEFQGKTAKDPGRYAFRVLQTYGSGETVQWTGPAGSKTPAAFVEVRPGGEVTDEHGAGASDHEAGAAPGRASAPGERPASNPAGAAAQSAPAAPAAPAAAPGGAATAAAAYGGAALGVIALILALRRR